MTRESGGILRRLVVLLLLGCAGWFLYAHWWPQNNLQRFGGRLETRLDQGLKRAGVTDRDLVSQIRKEHHEWVVTWVETQRTIHVPQGTDARQLAKSLDRVADLLGCTVAQSTTSDGMELRFTRFGCLL